MSFYSPDLNPEWVWAVLIALLGAAIAYGIMRNRQRSARDLGTTEQATKARYAQEDKKQRDAGR